MKDLIDWLELQFYNDNIKKYHKYFNEWASALTDDQIVGFQKCMIQTLTHSLQKH